LEIVHSLEVFLIYIFQELAAPTPVFRMILAHISRLLFRSVAMEVRIKPGNMRF
jgi:hypothetical protein